MKKIWYAPNQFEAYGEEEITAVVEALRAGWLAGWGPRTVEFEQRAEAGRERNQAELLRRDRRRLAKRRRHQIGRAHV